MKYCPTFQSGAVGKGVNFIFINIMYIKIYCSNYFVFEFINSFVEFSIYSSMCICREIYNFINDMLACCIVVVVALFLVTIEDTFSPANP